MDKNNKAISSFIREIIFKKTQPKPDSGQSMKKRLLTSFIENQKFVLNNKLQPNNKNHHFGKTTDRFKNLNGKDDLKGTLAIHKRAGLKCSFSLDNISSNNSPSKKGITSNKSQPLLIPLSRDKEHSNEPRPSKKKQIQLKNNGYATGSIYNLLMSTPKEETSKGRKRFSNIKHENNNIFGSQEPAHGNKKPISLSKQRVAVQFPVRDKTFELFERMKINKKSTERDENREIYLLKKNLSNFKEPVKLKKSSSQVFNHSLSSTKDINTLRSNNNRSIETNQSNDNSKLNVIKLR